MFELLKKYIRKQPKLYKELLMFLLITSLFVVFEHFLISPPADFPQDTLITIQEGSSLQEISLFLEQEKVVRSAALLQFFAILFKGDQRILAGDYVFKEKLSVFLVAHRLVTGDYKVTPIKITIPEGLTIEEIAYILTESLLQFDKEKFLQLTEGKEGYLFPDTYLFFPSVEMEQIIKKMSLNFQRKITPLEGVIAGSGYSLKEIITMASLIEKESRDAEERRVISGILWKRLEERMLLQVDASFLYINGKGTFDLTKEDLAIDSPYNTYKYLGLPPSPINNPGLDAIAAALYPEESDYLFYLHGNNGNIHYAVNFEDHKRNKWRYLR